MTFRSYRYVSAEGRRFCKLKGNANIPRTFNYSNYSVNWLIRCFDRRSFSNTLDRSSEQHYYQTEWDVGVLTWVPWAAGPVRPASRTSSAGADAADAPRRPEHSCIAAAAGHAGRPRTAPAGSSPSARASAAGWPLPAASPEHAGGGDKFC